MTFAVHELLGLPPEIDALARCERIGDLEAAALAVGVPLAEPVRACSGAAATSIEGALGPFTVHRWVDAPPLEGKLGSPSLYRHLGLALGRLHSLQLDTTELPGDAVNSHPTLTEWQELADTGRALGWAWADDLRNAGAEFVETLEVLDTWDAAADPTLVFSHRDLTSANLLDDNDTPVLIDWESAGPIARGVEIGRTALDQLELDGQLDQQRLKSMLSGYAEFRPLPAVGHDWCSLWLRGLIVFAEECARACIAGNGPSTLLRRQAHVVETSPAILRRRLAIVDDLVETLGAAATTLS